MDHQRRHMPCLDPDWWPSGWTNASTHQQLCSYTGLSTHGPPASEGFALKHDHFWSVSGCGHGCSHTKNSIRHMIQPSPFGITGVSLYPSTIDTSATNHQMVTKMGLPKRMPNQSHKSGKENLVICVVPRGIDLDNLFRLCFNSCFPIILAFHLAKTTIFVIQYISRSYRECMYLTITKHHHPSS